MTIDQNTLLEYVMGALSSEQEKEVVAHLREHPEDAAWVRDMFDTVATLALSQEPVSVAEGAEEALLKRVRRETPDQATPDQEGSAQTDTQRVTERSSGKVVTLPQEPPPSSRRAPWLGFALAAALALIAWVGLRPAYQNYAVARQLDSVCSEAGASCEPLVSDTNETLGTLARRSDNALFVVLETPPPDTQVYQAWEIVDGTPHSLGVWQGRVLDITQPLDAQSLFGVSVEPPGGSAQPTTTPIVVVPLDS